MDLTTTALDIPDVLLVESRLLADDRGFFFETWHEQRFAQAGIAARFVQDNHCRSRQGVLRGLHYQIAPDRGLDGAQGKLVRVAAGVIYDVAVDLRRSSPTFGRWLGIILSSESARSLWIPPGLAHGYYVLSTTADVSYKCADYYRPELERAILWSDATLAIRWPLATGETPLISAKDAAAVSFNDAPCYR
jgi:dTDP-4-dehydrorhamnose 3,5-epimerase